MEIFGVKTSEETQVDMILDTLLGSFKQFKLNYNLNKLMMSLLELKKEFHMAKRIIKDSINVHMVVKDSLGSSHTNKKKNSFKKSKQGKTRARKGKRNGKVKCFICGKKGHWNKECPNYLKKRKKGISHSLLVESCLMVDSTNSR